MQISAPALPVDLSGSESALTSLGHGRSADEAIQEFEAVFVSMLLKQMRQSVSGDGIIPGDSSDVVGGLFDQYLGQHISRAGGLGLAESLQRAL